MNWNLFKPCDIVQHCDNNDTVLHVSKHQWIVSFYAQTLLPWTIKLLFSFESYGNSSDPLFHGSNPEMTA